MPYPCNLVVELSNLNRTADFLISKNNYLRNKPENPIHLVLEQLLASTRKIITESSLEQLITDSKNFVHYDVSGQSAISFWITIWTLDKQNLTTPTISMLGGDQNRYVEVLHVDSIDKTGFVFEPRFYVQLGADFVNTDPAAVREN